jgi:hypothetical protein
MQDAVLAPVFFKAIGVSSGTAKPSEISIKTY